MADWKQIPDTDVDPDAPITSELMYALRDNPVAVAEGAIGAPKIHPNAIQPKIFEAILGFNTPVTVTDLDTSLLVEFYFFLSKNGGTGSLTLEWRASNDNGSTFGAWGTSPLGSPGLTSSQSESASVVSRIARLSDGSLFEFSPTSTDLIKFTSNYPTNAMSFRVTGTSARFVGAKVIILSRGIG